MKRIVMMLLVYFSLLCLLIVSIGEEEVSYEDIQATQAIHLQDEIITPSPAPVPSVMPRIEDDGSTIITISAIGDVTIGRNQRFSGSSIFEKELKKQNNDISFVFRNIKSILEADDLTIANFEGTLADEYSVPNDKAGNEYLFIAPRSYIQSLVSGSIEAVALENNHVYDFGEEGYTSTANTLENAGITWSNATKTGSYETQGIKIAMLSYQTFNGKYPALFERVPIDIANVKLNHDIVIVSYHWGEELDYQPNENQVKLGKLTIDSGADLVLGHHSHRMNPIEEYNGKYIVYSLGNISFAGNNKPDDMFTFIFQIRFKQKDGLISSNGFRIIPCRISSRTDYNDFTPTPLDKQIYIDNIISILMRNGKSLVNPVAGYPLDWE